MARERVGLEREPGFVRKTLKTVRTQIKEATKNWTPWFGLTIMFGSATLLVQVSSVALSPWWYVFLLVVATGSIVSTILQDIDNHKKHGKD